MDQTLWEGRSYQIPLAGEKNRQKVHTKSPWGCVLHFGLYGESFCFGQIGQFEYQFNQIFFRSMK